MELLDEVLYTIGQDTVDFAICDEAHTLASTRNNRRNFILNDGRVKISKRFFLTATEKNLINPDNLQEGMVDNFMNNEDVFGKYLFKYSFADGVVNKHVVPFTAKIYEYSSRNYQMSEMLNTLKSMKLEQFESLTVKGDEYTEISPKLAKSIVSIDKTLKESNKVLVICSRNSHVYSLDVAIRELQNQGKYFQGCDVTNIVASDYTPVQRGEILEDIDQRNNKQIIVVGPWAITGVDCPSIDAVYWNFTPGNEISVAQGTGRGTRIIEGKSHLLVCFNLDIDDSNKEIKDTILNTLVKLYEAQFPSHEVMIKQVRRILGRRFLSVERDTEAQVETLTRMNLDEIYEAAEGRELINMIESRLVRRIGLIDFEKATEIRNLYKNNGNGTDLEYEISRLYKNFNFINEHQTDNVDEIIEEFKKE
jgi:superfamily II DNA or RNA helicase